MRPFRGAEKIMITSAKFATDLCRALELDMSRITSINISMLPNQPVTVTIERAVVESEADEIVKVVKQYTLVDKQDTE
jgi:hypothetical protein